MVAADRISFAMLRRGQALVEYVLSLAVLLVVVTIIGWVVTAAFRASERANDIVRLAD